MAKIAEQAERYDGKKGRREEKGGGDGVVRVYGLCLVLTCRFPSL
jgi:hypothetical protein